MKILLSAYSCGPGRGSEPGVGWGAAVSLAEHAEVHVLTTFEFREPIEQMVADGGVPKNMHFHFFDLPGARWWWKHGHLRGIQIHYALWQRFAGRVVQALQRKYQFDAAQHVTFVRYWSPSCLRNSGIPYIFGPVAGADLPPNELIKEYPWRQKLIFLARKVIRWLGERNPATRTTLRNAAHVFAATPATLERCQALGVPEERLSLCQAIALGEKDIEHLSKLPFSGKPVFFGMGLMQYLKRFDLAIRAFAKADIPDSQLILIGGGPEENHLHQLAVQLNVSNRVEITGFLPRQEALSRLSETAVMLHPSNLESGGLALLESLAAGRPAIALAIGGPAMLLDESRGCKIAPVSSDQIVDDMAVAMQRIAVPNIRHSMAEKCHQYVTEHANWRSRAAHYAYWLSICSGMCVRTPE